VGRGFLVMAGPAPAIHVLFTGRADDRCVGGWVYIMSNKLNGTLYVGVTSDLIRRVWDHREGQAAASFAGIP
jgi:putative endonuclease